MVAALIEALVDDCSFGLRPASAVIVEPTAAVVLDFADVVSSPPICASFRSRRLLRRRYDHRRFSLGFCSVSLLLLLLLRLRRLRILGWRCCRLESFSLSHLVSNFVEVYVSEAWPGHYFAPFAAAAVAQVATASVVRLFHLRAQRGSFSAAAAVVARPVFVADLRSSY